MRWEPRRRGGLALRPRQNTRVRNAARSASDTAAAVEKARRNPTTITEPLQLTIDHEESEGQVSARVREVPGPSASARPGRRRGEAALDALGELAPSYVDADRGESLDADVVEVFVQSR